MSPEMALSSKHTVALMERRYANVILPSQILVIAKGSITPLMLLGAMTLTGIALSLDITFISSIAGVSTTMLNYLSISP